MHHTLCGSVTMVTVTKDLIVIIEQVYLSVTMMCTTEVDTLCSLCMRQHRPSLCFFMSGMPWWTSDWPRKLRSPYSSRHRTISHENLEVATTVPGKR